MPSCRCSRKPDFFRASTTHAHFREMPVVSRKPDRWVHLLRCPACSQHWQVDVVDKYFTGLAIKIPDPAGWQGTDDLDIRRPVLVALRGGLGHEPCCWAGCTKPVLKGLAYCPDCAYHKVGITE